MSAVADVPVTASRSDVVVIGAGHNALVAAVLLARGGLSVTVVEQADVVGGAARTEQPFPRAPELRASTGAYLLGLMPPELMAELGLELPLVRRDPHYFLPTTGDRYLLFGSDAAETRRQMEAFFSTADWSAHTRLQTELDQLREDVAPTWLTEPVGIEETAERHVRPALRTAFVDLCRGSALDYLRKFGFESDLLVAMYAVTDGVSGLSAGIATPGSGMNFLVHNMCRLPGADGTWMIVAGGMGEVTRRLALLAHRAGAAIRTGVGVMSIDVSGGAVQGVTLADGSVIRTSTVVAGCDPFRLRALAGDALPAAFAQRLDAVERTGTTMKVNLALSGLPRFTCLPEDRGQHSATMHLLPQDDDVLGAIERSWADAASGRLADVPTIEWYLHTTADPSLRDAAGHHSSALFVQWVPYALEGSSWEAEESAYVERLLGVCDRFAPGTSDLVVDYMALTPPKIEAHFGITGGHIHHVDNTVGFADRIPYAVGVDGLYAASAGCHPAGSVIGAAGHNAAKKVLADLGR